MTSLARSLHAEWTKARTVPSTAWLVVFVVVSMIGLSLAITGTLRVDECEGACLRDTVKLSLSGVRLAQIGTVILGVLAVSGEYATRTITPSLTAVPRRSLVLVGKLGVVAALTLSGALAGVVGALVTARIVLPQRGFTATAGYPRLSLWDDLTQRAAVGTLLYLVLLALLSAGIALLVRDTGGAIVLVLSLLFLAPVFSMFITNPHWQTRLHRLSPMDAGLAIQSTRDLAALSIAAWPGMAVLTAYATAAVGAGAAALRLRDA
jgi:ABC-2 type transport system permease protein